MTQSLAPERTAPEVGETMARFVLAVDRFALAVAQHWLAAVGVGLGLFILLPFAAPALMAVGLTAPADMIYFIYGFVCHQLPQRSFFLFGHKTSYSLAELYQAYPFQSAPELRSIIGNSAMGWKMAWSDRMLSLYGSVWIGGVLYGLLRNRLPRLSPIVWLVFAIVPMGLDGITHSINDVVAGISGTGFRDTNAWLAGLTGNMLPKFYAGDALGSFNNLARLITGTLTGLLTVWFLYPYIDSTMTDLKGTTRTRLSTPRAAALLSGEQTVMFQSERKGTETSQ